MEESGAVFNIQKIFRSRRSGHPDRRLSERLPPALQWCSNPESQKPHPPTGLQPNKCLTLENCVRCLEVCTAGVDQSGEENRSQVDREICNDCLLCTKACPSARPELLRRDHDGRPGDPVRSEEDGVFYSRSGGGLTLGGRRAAAPAGVRHRPPEGGTRRRINTAMETCGFCRWEASKRPPASIWTRCSTTSKAWTPEKHTAFTGVSNELILDNFESGSRNAFPKLPMQVRTPIVPGFNDSEEAVRPILEHIRDMPNVRFEALHYHRMGSPSTITSAATISWPKANWMRMSCSASTASSNPSSATCVRKTTPSRRIWLQDEPAYEVKGT